VLMIMLNNRSCNDVWWFLNKFECRSDFRTILILRCRIGSYEQRKWPDAFIHKAGIPEPQPRSVIHIGAYWNIRLSIWSRYCYMFGDIIIR